MRKVPSVILLVAGVLVGLLFVAAPSRSVIYQGKVTFETEAQYSEFKRAVSQPYAKYDNNDILVLSSEPPIVVQFTVTMPLDRPFPYGSRDIVSDIAIVVVGILIIGVGLIFGGGPLLDKTNWE